MRGVWKTKEEIPFLASAVLESGAFLYSKANEAMQAHRTPRTGGHQNADHAGDTYSLSKTIRMDLAEADWRMHRSHGDHGKWGPSQLEPADAGTAAPARAFARGAALGISASHGDPRGIVGK